MISYTGGAKKYTHTLQYIYTEMYLYFFGTLWILTDAVFYSVKVKIPIQTKNTTSLCLHPETQQWHNTVGRIS